MTLQMDSKAFNMQNLPPNVIHQSAMNIDVADLSPANLISVQEPNINFQIATQKYDTSMPVTPLYPIEKYPTATEQSSPIYIKQPEFTPLAAMEHAQA